MKFQLAILTSLLLATGCATSGEPDSPGVTPPDVPGTNTYDGFNRWVYQQMNDQYLWRGDLPDSLDCNYDLPPSEFFESLLSAKDRFSYFRDNPYYSRAEGNPGRDDYGFAYQKVRDTNGSEWLYVLYVYGQEAKRKGVRRGDMLKETGPGVYRKAVVSGDEITDITLKLDIDNGQSTVLLDTVYDMGNTRTGYLVYLEYDDEKDLVGPLTRFAEAQIDELILDLRYNPGGYVSTCKYLCNCIVPAEHHNDIFQICSYNDRLARANLIETGDENTCSYFEEVSAPGTETLGQTPVIPLNLKRLTVITSRHTASASEANIICLRPYMPVTLVGERTVGKGVGSWMIADSQYKYAIQPITMRYYNALRETTPDEGLTPDVVEEDGYSVAKKELGDINERLLNTALATIMPQTAPVPPSRLPSSDGGLILTPVGEPSYVANFKHRNIHASKSSEIFRWTECP